MTDTSEQTGQASAGREREHLPLSVLWTVTAAASVVLALLGGWAVVGVAGGPRPPFLSPAAGGPDQPRPGSDGDPGLLQLAGSGSNLPLTRALAESYMQRRPGTRVVVHESIGSTGGVRALLDGRIDVGLVSRPLRPSEADRGLRLTPYARVAVVFGVHPSVPDLRLDAETVLALYGGTLTTWPDGSPVRVQLRESGDSGHAAVSRVVPAFARVTQQAYVEQRWPVSYQDLAMQGALLTTPGAIGVFDLGAIRAQNLPLKAFTLDDDRPTPDRVRSGAYRLTKDLAFVTAGSTPPETERFLAFVASDEGRRLTEELGYVALEAVGGPRS